MQALSKGLRNELPLHFARAKGDSHLEASFWLSELARKHVNLDRFR